MSLSWVHQIKCATCVGISVATALFAPAGHAVEGGIGHYWLGTRDTFSGFVAEPGTYTGISYDYLSGSVEGLSVGGLSILADSDLTINMIRLNVTQVFDAQVFGGTPAVDLTIPILSNELAFTTVSPPIPGAQIDDTTSGIGDLTFTGLVGWHRDNLHYNAGLSIYAPTGGYDTATVDVANRTIDAISVGKNVWAFQPFVAATWFNPTTGLEASGAASFVFSTRNDATDYQSAPAFQLEGAVVQRLPSGWGFGLTGYTYQQLSDDSGSGADTYRAALGTDSLRAGVHGAGPIVTYSGGSLFGGDLSMKIKYTHEFGAKRRFESNVLTANLTLAF